MAPKRRSSKTNKIYEVGYKKPPKNTQFKKGVSGNSSGRPKKKNDNKQTFKAIFDKRVRAQIGGKQQQMNGLEIILWQLRVKASAGDLSAVRLYIDLLKYFDLDKSDEPNAQLKGLIDALKAGPADTP
jgi:Family of unknown function (DUF5681)